MITDQVIGIFRGKLAALLLLPIEVADSLKIRDKELFGFEIENGNLIVKRLNESENDSNGDFHD